jgi:hypothetical protein
MMLPGREPWQRSPVLDVPPLPEIPCSPSGEPGWQTSVSNIPKMSQLKKKKKKKVNSKFFYVSFLKFKAANSGLNLKVKVLVHY